MFILVHNTALLPFTVLDVARLFPPTSPRMEFHREMISTLLVWKLSTDPGGAKTVGPLPIIILNDSSSTLLLPSYLRARPPSLVTCLALYKQNWVMKVSNEKG